MAILLKRNSQRDAWFGVHSTIIEEGEVVKLTHIEGEPMRSEEYPPMINFIRKNSTGDKYVYTASLNCFDYIRECDRG